MRPQGLVVALGEGSNNNSSSGRNSNNGRRLDYKQLNWDLLLLLRRRRLQRRARRRRIDGACLSSVFFKELCVCSEGVFGLSSSSSAVRRGASFGKNRPFWGKKEEDLEGGEKKEEQRETASYARRALLLLKRKDVGRRRASGKITT